MQGYDTIGAHARMLSRRIKMLISVINTNKSKTTLLFINQLRSKVNDAWKGEFSTTTTGGKAMKYYSSIRIKIERYEYIKNSKDERYGFLSSLKIEKSRISRPQVSCIVPFIYGLGVKQEIYFVELAIKKNIIIKNGTWFSLKLSDKQEALYIKLKLSKNKFQGRFDLINEVCSNNMFFNFIKDCISTHVNN
jgi:recombination protein RecA